MLIKNSEKFLEVLPDVASDLKEYHETANALNTTSDYEDLVLKLLNSLSFNTGELLTDSVEVHVLLKDMLNREMKGKGN